MRIYRIAWEGAISVPYPVKLLGIRELGKNIPLMKFTYDIEEAEKWLEEAGGTKTHEIVSVTILPYKDNT